MNPYLIAAAVAGGIVILGRRPATGAPMLTFGNGRSPKQDPVTGVFGHGEGRYFPGEGPVGSPVTEYAAPVAWGQGLPGGTIKNPRTGSPLERFPTMPSDARTPQSVSNPVSDSGMETIQPVKGREFLPENFGLPMDGAGDPSAIDLQAVDNPRRLMYLTDGSW